MIPQEVRPLIDLGGSDDAMPRRQDIADQSHRRADWKLCAAVFLKISHQWRDPVKGVPQQEFIACEGNAAGEHDRNKREPLASMIGEPDMSSRSNRVALPWTLLDGRGFALVHRRRIDDMPPQARRERRDRVIRSANGHHHAIAKEKDEACGVDQRRYARVAFNAARVDPGAHKKRAGV